MNGGKRPLEDGSAFSRPFMLVTNAHSLGWQRLFPPTDAGEGGYYAGTGSGAYSKEEKEEEEEEEGIGGGGDGIGIGLVGLAVGWLGCLLPGQACCVAMAVVASAFARVPLRRLSRSVAQIARGGTERSAYVLRQGHALEQAALLNSERS